MKISTNLIPPEEIIKIAMQEAAFRNWKWEDPVKVHLGIRDYILWTNCNYRGGNIRMAINAYNGKLSYAYFLPK